MLKILFILLIFFISTVLFQKAAGTLHPGKLNIISCVYYIFMLQYFIGASLIMLGYDTHYTLAYLTNWEKSIEITIATVMITSILFPLILIVWQAIFRVKIKKEYNMFLKQQAYVSNQKVWWKIFCIGAVVCAIVLVGFLFKVGYVPILRLVHAPEGFDFGIERTRIANTYFIHPYVSNIILFTIVPIMSYIAFSYAMVTKEWKWRVLFLALFAISVICKTYKFEKTPVLFHLLIFVLIYIYLKGVIKLWYMAIMGAVVIVLLGMIYLVMGYSGTFLDIYNGPLGRTFFTEVGTLAYCFDMFPNLFGYLEGRSFSPTILKLLGKDATSHLRSAKLTMAFYGSEKVYDGTAGVMNTLFIGEAYANWGYLGVAFSIFWVAFVITLLVWIILKLKKTPSVVALMAILSVRIAMMIKGGFCDFVYSFDILFTVAALLTVYYMFESDSRLQRTVFVALEKVESKVKNGRKSKE